MGLVSGIPATCVVCSRAECALGSDLQRSTAIHSDPQRSAGIGRRNVPNHGPYKSNKLTLGRRLFRCFSAPLGQRKKENGKGCLLGRKLVQFRETRRSDTVWRRKFVRQSTVFLWPMPEQPTSKMVSCAVTVCFRRTEFV